MKLHLISHILIRAEDNHTNIGLKYVKPSGNMNKKYGKRTYSSDSYTFHPCLCKRVSQNQQKHPRQSGQQHFLVVKKQQYARLQMQGISVGWLHQIGWGCSGQRSSCWEINRAAGQPLEFHLITWSCKSLRTLMTLRIDRGAKSLSPRRLVVGL